MFVHLAIPKFKNNLSYAVKVVRLAIQKAPKTTALMLSMVVRLANLIALEHLSTHFKK
jgi:hypothetical protein